MKFLTVIFLSFYTVVATAQNIENVIIITTDGLRWQEVFAGMDSAIANDKRFNQGDSTEIYKKYWAANGQERRQKLMPFLWTTIKNKGQIYGNRTLGNKVDVANPYWFSYPGYNEIFTGYPDTLVNSNNYKPNPNTTFLEFLNKQPKFKNNVATFAAWDAYDRILNETKSNIPVINGYENSPLKTQKTLLLNEMLQNSHKPFGNEECLDVFTHYLAMDYLQTKKPKALYISYGETDEWAHFSKYHYYLNAANQVDKWLENIWNYIQATPQYKNKTALFITTDHGRGDSIKKEWTSHNKKIVGANEIWFAVIAPNVKAKGEIKNDMQLYQKQFAQTITSLLGYTFTCEHPVAQKINLNE